MKKIGLGNVAFVIVFCAAIAMAAPAQTFTILRNFSGPNGVSPGTLTQGFNGNFYGISGGGPISQGECAFGCGTVFGITSAGEANTIYDFCSQANCADGAFPQASLVLGTNGNFYGITVSGGSGICTNGTVGCGTVYEITPAGKLTSLYSFCTQANCADGDSPTGTLVQGRDGNFYGTTSYGGAYSTYIAGTVFKITSSGQLTTLHSFCSEIQGGNCPDGQGPSAGLTLGNDGNFYGTTYYGGDSGYGTVFKITPAGKLTILHSFCPQFPCSDGTGPLAGLVLGNDGNLYGATSLGANGYGALFKITPSGTLTPLYAFCSLPNCADGGIVTGQLTLGADGNFYGTTRMGGGANNGGTAFQITPAGSLTTLYNFCSDKPGATCDDGSIPYSGLTQATNGVFYGGTSQGGHASPACGYFGCGLAFSLSIDLGAFVETVPDFGQAGRMVKILGNNLSGATSVMFNGAPASFTVVSDTLISATVPTGARTGKIEVTTAGTNLSSNVPFQVLP